MNEERAKRKLSAILSADVKGYSRLMGENELATIEMLKKFQILISSLIEQFRGRVVDSPGDNLLAEFGSVVDAVECAVKIQEELKKENDEIPESRRMEFRIGVNLGDVVEDGARIYGDGINIAARLEALAEPGGICISGFVYNHVKNKLKLDYDYLGEKRVKNINEPIQVYSVLPFSDISEPTISKAKIDRMAYPLPEKPSIAVLPFDNMSDDPKQEYFCNGMTEEIITALSRHPGLFVIARNSTFTYKGKAVKVQQVSEDLGVRYVLEGSVKKAGDRIRITAQLIDALNGHHLWAESYDRELKDIFAVQDEITIKVVEVMGLKIIVGGVASALSIGAKNLKAYLKVIEGAHYMSAINFEDRIRAKKLYEEAIKLDPEYATPYALLGNCHFMDIMQGTTKSPKESLREASKLAQKVLNMDETHPQAHILLGLIHFAAGRYDKAIPAFELGFELNPSNTRPLILIGQSLEALGKPQEAIPHFQRALRINPLAPGFPYWGLGEAHLLMGRYEEAIRYLKRSLEANPKNVAVLRNLAFCYVALERNEEARAVAPEILKLNPEVSVKKWVERMPFNQDLKERMQAALLKIGLPK